MALLLSHTVFFYIALLELLLKSLLIRQECSQLALLRHPVFTLRQPTPVTTFQGHYLLDSDWGYA